MGCFQFVVTLGKLHCISAIRTKKNFFILFCLQFAVTLHPEMIVK